VTVSEDFKHMKINNLYERLRVCKLCYNMYNKIDNLRASALGKKRKNKTPEEIMKEVSDYVNIHGTLSIQLN
jgi:hypothetical protein